MLHPIAVLKRTSPYMSSCRTSLAPVKLASKRTTPEPAVGAAGPVDFVRERDGAHVALLACGPHPVHAALEAHDQLAASGISARVLDVSTIKPLDIEAIIDAAIQTDGLITIEEHSVIGGLGSAVAEVLAEHAPARLRRIGMPDRFCEHVGSQEYLLRTYGITGKAVAEAAMMLLDQPVVLRRSRVSDTNAPR